MNTPGCCHKFTPRLGLLLWLLLLIGISAAGLWQWQQGARIETDILALLPKVEEAPLTQAALNRVEQQFGERLYLALVADTREQAISAARQVRSALQHSGAFTQVRSGDEGSLQALGHFYFPYRMQLLSDRQRQLLQQQQLQPLVQQLRQQLYNPFGNANSELLQQDPLLLFPDWLQQLAQGQKLQQQQGILFTRKGTQTAAIIMAKGVGSAFNPQHQQQQLQALQQALAHLPSSVSVLRAGALFHAAAATASAQQEISLIGGMSLLGVMLLVLLGLRSLRPLAVALLTLSSSFVVALAVTLICFNGLHLLTLVFGTSLVGIAIDYSFHFYCERLQSPHTSVRQSLRHIAPILTLALSSSVIAYGALGLTPFPGMQQVAVFCAAGLIFSWLTLLLAYPALAATPLPNGQAQLQWAQRCHYLAQQLFGRWRWLLGGMFLLLLTGLVHLQGDDDIRNLQQSPDSITQEEQQLRQLLSGGTDNQFLLVQGADEQQLLQRLEQLTPKLAQLQQQQLLGNFVSLSRFVPSARQQQQDYQLQAQVYQQLPALLPQLGLDDTLATALQQQYLAAAGVQLKMDDWLGTAAAQENALAQLWLPPSATHPQYGSIVLLGGIRQLATLQSLAASLPGVTLVDKVADISAVMSHFRQLTLWLLGLSLGLAALLFIWRYGLRRGLSIALVPMMAALLTLATLGWAGAGLTLFHALALLLVFGIGVDYSLFFASAGRHAAAVMLAVLLSASSTLLAFGLLAFSQTHAIAVFGQTLALGILFTLLLALLHTATISKEPHP
ncbi:MMPL family transporter [Shewanella sp. YIC-542]|uniref:MMPL family transporter n=1 Tax=Shewanella mytili TaxID=3377111 RepID=UPI00398E456C